MRSSKVSSALAQWPVPGEQITERTASTRPQPAVQRARKHAVRTAALLRNLTDELSAKFGHCGRWFINASTAGIGSPPDDGRAISMNGRFARHRAAVQHVSLHSCWQTRRSCWARFRSGSTTNQVAVERLGTSYNERLLDHDFQGEIFANTIDPSRQSEEAITRATLTVARNGPGSLSGPATSYRNVIPQHLAGAARGERPRPVLQAG
jgi:hypothetical protein